jgi:hypothetical protein
MHNYKKEAWNGKKLSHVLQDNGKFYGGLKDD